MRSSIAFLLVILSRTTQRALSMRGQGAPQRLSGGIDRLGTGLHRDRAATGREPALPAGLQEALAGLAFGDTGAAREEGLIGEAADRTARGDGREERRKIRVTGKARVP